MICGLILLYICIVSEQFRIHKMSPHIINLCINLYLFISCDLIFYLIFTTQNYWS